MIKSDEKSEALPEGLNPLGSRKFDLFVYGTLMNDHHVELLLNRKVRSIEAILYNYMRVVPNGGFPFIVKQNGAVTKGRILIGLSKEELERIDSFEDEGSLYFRRIVSVRIGSHRHRCMTYVGSIPALQASFGNEVKFEDRYNTFLEKKIDEIIDEMPTDRPDITRRVLRELMGSEVDSIIQSHFDGNYICNYIMIQAFEDARPPSLKQVLSIEELHPYAGNYMRLACQHIVFNQFVELIRHEFFDAVRVSQQYFRHGLAILMGFLFYNRNRKAIDRMLREKELDRLVPERSYRDYAKMAIEIVDALYDRAQIIEIIDFVEDNWYSTPTPIGAELEFSHLGRRAVYAEPGEDKVYDGFYWFSDFDMYRRTWRLGGHVDSHMNITAGQKRHRGFFEYALGRYQIVGDLSRPLFDCPWGMSLVINEAVKFLDIPPHSMHISMELSGGHSHISDQRHLEENLVCLLLLGGDIKPDTDGQLREMRIFHNELDTNFGDSLHFSDRKYHFSKPGQDESEASDTMEYKYLRLNREDTDYETVITALKGYQFHSHGRPIAIQRLNEPELPEQVFMRKWAADPQPVGEYAIDQFINTVEQGLLEENRCIKLNKIKLKVLEKIEKLLRSRNSFISNYREKYVPG